jgi:hypothetical protein
MKLKSIQAPFIIFQLVLFWLSLATAVAQPVTSRSATAASYARRDNAWAAQGDLRRPSGTSPRSLSLIRIG